jgi:hypothetical protein
VKANLKATLAKAQNKAFKRASEEKALYIMTKKSWLYLDNLRNNSNNIKYNSLTVSMFANVLAFTYLLGNKSSLSFSTVNESLELPSTLAIKKINT